jgi:hypothetical protein
MSSKRDSRKKDGYKPDALSEAGAKIKADYDAIGSDKKKIDKMYGRTSKKKKKGKRAGNTKTIGLQGFGQIPKLQR